MPPQSARPKEGELSAAIELRRHFARITDNAKARACRHLRVDAAASPVAPRDAAASARTASKLGPRPPPGDRAAPAPVLFFICMQEWRPGSAVAAVTECGGRLQDYVPRIN